ncbi:CDP-glycerol glycerophosphotransferase family protein [Microbacterium sp. NIBRBAC000506063]|uniref:CDP-glycerol glycerophosphotransferase family protein n=1 Tax=Microbacterium sp. NIBRBAC000506063 TaxID=2734618 RepID=UPI001CB6D816|nr:CDP-glycerol glycerophosphotransferase family protein [Microbacterium sp. NIBRBAC000506063]
MVDGFGSGGVGCRGTRHPDPPKNGLRGWWATARAGVVVVTHGFGDVNRYATADAFVVQLWHGIPLKRIGLDSPETTRLPAFPGSRFGERLLRALYRRAAQRIQVLPAASHRSRGRLESAFGLPPGASWSRGAARGRALGRGSRTAAEGGIRSPARCARRHRPAGRNTRHILYAPTWRDGAPDPAVPSAAEWVQIVSLLERREAVLLVRPHPLGAGAYTPPFPTRRVRMLTSDIVADVAPLLPAIDVLVTDYSSLVFDVGLLAMPVVLLAPDAAEYARTRGFYGRFEDVAGSDAAGPGRRSSPSWSDCSVTRKSSRPVPRDRVRSANRCMRIVMDEALSGCTRWRCAAAASHRREHDDRRSHRRDR